MPYRTPDVSSYIMIKRLQTDISGQAEQGPYKFRAPPLTYGGYFAGLANIKSFPVNALLSNKFIQPSFPVQDTWYIDISDNVDRTSATPPYPVSKIVLTTTTGTSMQIGLFIDFTNSTGYSFSGTTADISPSSAAEINTQGAGFLLQDSPVEDNFTITITLTSSSFVGPIDILFNQ
jgi:hypothetical protein